MWEFLHLISEGIKYYIRYKKLCKVSKRNTNNNEVENEKKHYSTES